MSIVISVALLTYILVFQQTSIGHTRELLLVFGCLAMFIDIWQQKHPSHETKIRWRDVKTKIIGGTTPAKSILGSVEKQVCTLVKTCLKKEIGHPSFNDNFTVLSHSKMTRNNNLTLKLPAIMLKVSRPSSYFDAVKIFNQLPVSQREFLI